MKKKIIKGIKYISIIVIIVITGLLSYVSLALPEVGDPEAISIEVSPERVTRGKYLANSVNACMDCHSTRDWNKFAGPVIEGTLGKGGEEFNKNFGLPGTFYSKNITPFALKNWTDGEILRAISSGVSRDGSPIFPLMPHPNYGKSDREDLYSIIAYIRTLEPIENIVPKSKPEFPMNFIMHTIPQKAQFSKIPDQNNQVAYGAYLFNAADCLTCHSKQKNGAPIPGMELAGGFEFKLPRGGTVRSANITPDNKTGIGTWSEEVFVNRFKTYSNSSYKLIDVKPGEFNTVMPWMMYSTMKQEDLKAIYAYLRTLKPIKHTVIKFSREQIN